MNTQSKHTPGPWRTIESTNKTMRTVVGPDFPGQGYIADVNLCRTNDAQDVDGEANAHLIAAAPAMYDALRELTNAFALVVKMTPYGVSMDVSKVHDNARAALAQAEGRG